MNGKSNMLLIASIMTIFGIMMIPGDVSAESNQISVTPINGEISLENSHFGVLVVGFLAAFISGLFACTWMISLVKKSKLSYFAIYCIIVGLGAILYAFTH